MSNGKNQTLEEKKAGIQFRTTEGFVEQYVDNSQLLSSNWSLEIVFGHLDQKQGPDVVVQTQSITMPWAAAKALSYFLQLHVMGHESDFGRIIIPAGIIPEFPTHKPKELSILKDEAFQAARKYYLDFITRNPEAAPKPKE
jgi:hypothetical protein